MAYQPIRKKTYSNNDTVTMVDNTEYRPDTSASIETVTFDPPSSGDYECWIYIETDASSPISITINPNGIIGSPVIGNNEGWEISVKDDVAIAFKVF